MSVRPGGFKNQNCVLLPLGGMGNRRERQFPAR